VYHLCPSHPYLVISPTGVEPGPGSVPAAGGDRGGAGDSPADPRAGRCPRRGQAGVRTIWDN